MSHAVKSSEIAVPIKAAVRRIRLKAQKDKEAKKISAEHAISDVAARVLAARNFKAGPDLKNFLNPTLREGLPGPSGIKNIDKAVALIAKTIEAGGGIAICCDFDVDGLSGGAQVYHFFHALGVKTQVFVPDRFEDGYGLNEGMVREIAAAGFAMLLTIDYGTTNEHEITIAKSLGLAVIVVDHHHVGAHKPPADVLINPQQKGCGFADGTLCAAGLAWYLVAALKSGLPAAANIDPKAYLDLACLGTICDMVPLTGPNRVIAKRGLELLTRTVRPGLNALKSVAGIHKDVRCYDVGFGIGPRLNAAGRMVNGSMVIELLSTDSSVRAQKVAQKLNKLNEDRQETEKLIKERALKKVMGLKQLPHGLVVWERSFHTGVIGIVAQRLVETFYRPTVVLGYDQDGIYKGSVRGIKGFSVVEALGSLASHLLKFGGHDGAGGLSIKEECLPDFALAFAEECSRRLEEAAFTPYVEADTEVEFSELTLNLVEEFKDFAPFGVGNPAPQLLAKKLKIVDIKVLKGAHLKISFTNGKLFFSGFLWRQLEHPAIAVGKTVDVVFKPDTNTYGGLTEIQLNVQAVQESG